MMKCTSNEELLQAFFSGENKVKFNSQLVSDVQSVEMARKSLNASTEIKHLTGSYGSYVRDYLFCDDFVLTNQLIQWIQHSLGTSHTELPELYVAPKLDYETELLKRYKHGVVVVKRRNPLPNLALNSQEPVEHYIESVISRVINSFNRRPALESKVIRPLGRILRDFFWSCNQHDGKQAHAFFQEIKNQELLDHRNLLSLELQAYEAGYEWHKITSHPQLEHLLSGVVAQKVVELVLKAHLESQEINTENLNSVNWQALEEALLDHQSFFRRKPMLEEDTPSSVYLWKAWAILAFALNIKGFAEHLPECVPQAWVQQLLSIVRNSESTSELVESQVVKLIALECNLENAVKVLEYGETCFEGEIKPLVEWLFELPQLVVRQIKSNKVLRGIFNQMEDIYYDQFPVTQIDEDGFIPKEYTEDNFDHETLKTENSADRESEKVAHTNNHIETWSDWFSGRDKVLTISYDYFRGWPIDRFDGDAVLHAIEDTVDAEVIRNVLPHFIKWVDEREVPADAPLWIALLELLAIDERKSIVTLELLMELAERSLTLGLIKSEYDRVIDAISICQDDGLTLYTFSKFIELYELVYQYTPLNSKGLADTFGSSLIDFANQNWSRLSISQKVTFGDMHYLLLGYEFPDISLKCVEEQHADLSSIKMAVGLYSLSESTLSRAKDVIEKYCPNVAITLNSDKTNTAALSNMVKKSDKVFFCDRSAAHQAYYAIKAISKDIVYVGGKGSSSIVRAFLDEVS
ncbi:protein DpdD [Vibrio splendidus]